MYLIVGLGNPEPEYSNTRHNMGFDTINKIATKYDIQVNKSNFKGLYGIGNIEGEKVILLKPQTYMNLSGESLICFKNFYKLDNSNIIVIYDDIDISVEEVRIRKKGTAGTHNGMKSVVGSLNSENFARIRVGVGKPNDNVSLMDYLLNPISKDDRIKLEAGINKASEALVEILKNGIDKAMNKFN